MRTIPLTQDLETLVDDEDYETLNHFKWYAAKRGRTYYAARNVLRNGRRTTVYLHKELTGWPQVEHKNRNGLDNTQANLRQSNQAQNLANKGPKKNGTSRFKGVTWCKVTKSWAARLFYNSKLVYYERFDDEELAARSYDRVALKYHGEFAYQNFP